MHQSSLILDKLHLFRIQSPVTGTCEKPIPIENVAENIYNPLSRPLFIYVNKSALDSKPSVKEFVNFYIENSKKWARGAGYVELPNEAYEKLKQKLASGETGTKFQDVEPGKPITDFI